MMMTNSSTDRWLLPRRQTEYPGRDVVPEARLHGRREATFLVLAALFLVATSALVVLGTSRVVDVSALVASLGLDVELPLAMLVPLGVVPFAVSFVASALVCQLFGRRRAAVLVGVGLFASLALAALMWLADVIDGGQAFAGSLALTACFIVAHALHLVVFDLLHVRRVFVPLNVASMLAQIAGWTVFGLVLHVSGGVLIDTIAAPTLAALAAGSAACAFGFVLVLSIPAALAGRGLAVALRVGRDELDDIGRDGPEDLDGPAFAAGTGTRRLPAALIVDDDDDQPPVPSRPPRAVTPPPFTSAEMRFFHEGDAIAD
jgi:uncharacterized PurR-regulated membrane protein YhhQ (DUF165 family)